MIQEKRLVDSFLSYIKVDSESKHEGEIAKILTAELENLGMEVYVDKAGEKINSQSGNIIAFLKGDSTKEPILFSAHMDTVVPGKGIKPIIKDGVIYSDGTTILGGDDKSGVAAIIEAIKSVKEDNLPHAPVEVVFSVCEEIGLLGAKNLDYSKIKSKKAVVLDGGGNSGSITTAAPGQINIEVSIFGKASHAGSSPEEGISAIMVGAEAISNMHLLRIDAETTANIGTFEALSPTNIVAEKAVIIAEARSRNKEKLKAQGEHMMQCLNLAAAKYGASIEGGISKNYEAYTLDLDDAWLGEIKSAYKACGQDVILKAGGGGSDANIMNLHGIKAVVVGTGMNGAHTVHEDISINNLTAAAKFVRQLIAE